MGLGSVCVRVVCLSVRLMDLSGTSWISCGWMMMISFSFLRVQLEISRVTQQNNNDLKMKMKNRMNLRTNKKNLIIDNHVKKRTEEQFDS